MDERVAKVMEQLKKNRFEVTYFDHKEAARDYLVSEIQHTTVGIGDSETLVTMGMYDALIGVNELVECCNHPHEGDSFKDIAKRTLGHDVFMTSVNALAEMGELVNIDGTGNRVAGTLFGSNRVYLVVGINKLTPDLTSAVERARNVAAVANSIRHEHRTPCAIKQDHCYDCASPDRICNALTIYYKKMRNVDRMEIVIIGEELGF